MFEKIHSMGEGRGIIPEIFYFVLGSQWIYVVINLLIYLLPINLTIER